MKKTLFAFVVLALGNFFSVNSVVAAAESEYWLAFAPSSQPKINHSPWQKFLSAHMSDAAHPIWRHRFDPTGVSRRDKRRLNDYIDSMEKIDPRYYPYEDQLAYWLNLYNAITVSFMIGADDFNDIKNHREKRIVTIAGKKISQRYIAENILMPIWKDSSLYFLLSCGAVDCPPVPYKAFTARNDARQQAKPAMQAYIDGPEGLRLESGKLYLPRAFEHFSTYYDSPNGMMKRLAFSVGDDLAIKLLGHSGPIIYTEHKELASPQG